MTLLDFRLLLPLLVLIAFVGGAAFLTYRWSAATGQFERDIEGLLSEGELFGHELQDVSQALERGNSHCPGYTFGVQRGSQVEFRGQRVWFLLGDVVTILAGRCGANTSRSRMLYALAVNQEQAGWMRQNADVFSPVGAASSSLIFWVNLKALKASKRLREVPVESGLGSSRRLWLRTLGFTLLIAGAMVVQRGLVYLHLGYIPHSGRPVNPAALYRVFGLGGGLLVTSTMCFWSRNKLRR